MEDTASLLTVYQHHNRDVPDKSTWSPSLTSPSIPFPAQYILLVSPHFASDVTAAYLSICCTAWDVACHSQTWAIEL